MIISRRLLIIAYRKGSGPKAATIRKHLQIIIVKTTDENGDFLRNWKDMTSIEKAALVRAVHTREPWLERHFQGGWGTRTADILFRVLAKLRPVY